MKIKTKFIATSVMLTLAANALPGFAKLIPGVDIPYDPASYYSPTAISYPDSKPSVFALKELTGGAGYGAYVGWAVKIVAEQLVSGNASDNAQLGLEDMEKNLEKLYAEKKKKLKRELTQ